MRRASSESSRYDIGISRPRVYISVTARARPAINFKGAEMSTVEKFEYVFLGGGKGGKTLAMELAKAGKRVAVVEEGMIGGSCINIACIPSKALIQSARIMHAVQSADILQGGAHDNKVDMTKVHRRVRE